MRTHEKGSAPLKPTARRQARHYALQAIYAWQLSSNNIADIEAHMLTQPDLQQADVPYFRDLLAGVARHYVSLDQTMVPYLTLTRSIDQLGPIEKAILRLALYELTQRLDVPYKVVINEAIELAKAFGAQESHKFINGVLDKTVSQLRSA